MKCLVLLEDEEEGGRVIITSASQAGGHAIVHILVLALLGLTTSSHDSAWSSLSSGKVKLNKNNLLPRNVGLLDRVTEHGAGIERQHGVWWSSRATSGLVWTLDNGACHLHCHWLFLLAFVLLVPIYSLLIQWDSRGEFTNERQPDHKNISGFNKGTETWGKYITGASNSRAAITLYTGGTMGLFNQLNITYLALTSEES